jgi:mono/diheme cytochrome c family protein
MERETMKTSKLLPLAAILLAGTVAAWSQSAGTPQATAKAVAKKSGIPQAEGQRVFEQNCSRCHNPPEGFSSRISGTIARHMRVRAGLSQHEEQAILRFFNP